MHGSAYGLRHVMRGFACMILWEGAPLLQQRVKGHATVVAGTVHLPTSVAGELAPRQDALLGQVLAHEMSVYVHSCFHSFLVGAAIMAREIPVVGPGHCPSIPAWMGM